MISKTGIPPALCAALLIAAWCLAGCFQPKHAPNDSAPAKPGNEPNASVVAGSIRARQTNFFGNVILWKPSGEGTDLAFQMAPLIVQPAAEGATHLTATGATNVIFTGSDVTQVQGKPLARIYYIWQNSMLTSKNGQGAGMQGVRMTLGPSGRPFLWEALADSTGIPILYISQAVEEAANKEFGSPIQGKTWSIEGGDSQNGNHDPNSILIARVLQDGPVPMGPVIYMENSGTDIATMICRCMPSQATNVLGTRTYILEQTRAPWPGSSFDLLEHLRLPSLERL